MSSHPRSRPTAGVSPEPSSNDQQRGDENRNLKDARNAPLPVCHRALGFRVVRSGAAGKEPEEEWVEDAAQDAQNVVG